MQFCSITDLLQLSVKRRGSRPNRGGGRAHGGGGSGGTDGQNKRKSNAPGGLNKAGGRGRGRGLVGAANDRGKVGTGSSKRPSLAGVSDGRKGIDYETYDEGPEDFDDHCESRNCVGN